MLAELNMKLAVQMHPIDETEGLRFIWCKVSKIQLGSAQNSVSIRGGCSFWLQTFNAATITGVTLGI